MTRAAQQHRRVLTAQDSAAEQAAEQHHRVLATQEAAAEQATRVAAKQLADMTAERDALSVSVQRAFSELHSQAGLTAVAGQKPPHLIGLHRYC